MTVVDPEGRTIRVGRRWLPWRRRSWDIDPSTADSTYVDGADDPVSCLLAIVAAVLMPFVVVLVLFLGEIFLLLLLLPVAALVRLVFGTPWTVEATHRGQLLRSERVRGWTDSGVRVMELAAAYERGEEPVPSGRTSG